MTTAELIELEFYRLDKTILFACRNCACVRCNRHPWQLLAMDPFTGDLTTSYRIDAAGMIYHDASGCVFCIGNVKDLQHCDATGVTKQ